MHEQLPGGVQQREPPSLFVTLFPRPQWSLHGTALMNSIHLFYIETTQKCQEINEPYSFILARLLTPSSGVYERAPSPDTDLQSPPAPRSPARPSPHMTRRTPCSSAPVPAKRLYCTHDASPVMGDSPSRSFFYNVYDIICYNSKCTDPDFAQQGRRKISRPPGP